MQLRTFAVWLSTAALLFTLSSVASAQIWVLSGNVVDGSGAGLANVDIDIFNTATGVEILTLSGDVTDLTGAFALSITTPIPAGLYDIVFRPAPGTALFENQLGGVFIASSTALGTVVLDSGFLVNGRVLDDSGLPLPEVDLEFVNTLGVPFAASGDVTDALGEFVVLVPEDIYDIEFRVTPLTPLGPWVPVLLGNVLVASNVNLGDIIFKQGYAVSGSVVNSLLQPVVGADIDVRDAITGEKIHTPSDNTDAAGLFDVLVPSGDWLVEVDPPVGPPLVTVELSLPIVAAAADLGAIILADGIVIIGTTVDSLGSAVPDVDLDFEISSSGIEIPTAHDNAGPDGNFNVVVPAETYDVYFRPPFLTGLAPVVIENLVATVDLSLGNVTLPAGNALTGVVSASGMAVSLVELSLVDSLTSLPVYTFGDSTNVLGAYGIRQVSGTYDVTFTPPLGSGLETHVELGVVLNSDVQLDIELQPIVVVPTEFLRGDANEDLTINIADAIFVLEMLFSGGSSPACDDSADSNDDGSVDISDVITVLEWLFSGSADLPPPFLAPGFDPTPDALTCP